ncbi:RidA family protein [Octadecabacter sp. G9-8]|uniref:RidA family protein n=1 Tax=Octadecabacter dasysiphoniae TaxID=2909341 RepID=A0ABS9CTC9_9RHOB|nr:Rid family hydrolase [Octadecabacter dasysiphoniae]MCF2870470.1 RidA family protein [Octadecabacter dasysiphoniae]
MTIEREPADIAGRSLTTAHNGVVYAVAYDPAAADGIVAQTQNALAFLDDRLAGFGASKAGLLQVTIYLHDMANKGEMDRVWTAWIGPQDNWPQRACVGADLGDRGTTLIEIVAIAAQFPIENGA